MSRFFRFFIVFALWITVIIPFGPLQAQDTLFDPAKLEVIMPANLSRLTEIAAIGNGGPGQLTWSPDGQTLIVSNPYGLWLHDAHNLEIEPRFIPEPLPDVLRFSPDSSQLFTWHENRDGETVRTWDVKTAQRLEQDWDEQGLAVHPYWHYWVAIDNIGPLHDQRDRATFIDIKTNETISSYEFKNPIGSEISQDNMVFVATDGYETVVFDVATGQPIMKIDNRAESNTGYALSPDGKLLLTSQQDGPILVRDVRTGKTLSQLEDSESWYGLKEFTPDNQHFMIVLDIGSARLWDLSSGNIIYTIQTQAKFQSVYTRDQLFIGQDVFAIGPSQLENYYQDTLWIYNLQSGPLQTTIQTTETEHSFSDYKFSPDNHFLATISDKGVLRLWDTTAGSEISTTNRYDLPGQVKAISPDSQVLITWVYEGHHFWDIETGQITKTIPEVSDYPRDVLVKFSPDGQQLVIGSRLYDVTSGTQLYSFDGANSDLDFSPDSQLLAMTHGAKSGFCYDYEKETLIPGYLEIIEADTGTVRATIPDSRPEGCGFTAVAFSPDGSLLAANLDGYKGGVLLWAVQAVLDGDLMPLAVLAPGDHVGALAFSPDSSQLLAGYAILITIADNEHLSSYNASAWDIASALKRADQGETEIRPNIDFFLPIMAEGASTIGYTPDGSIITAYGGNLPDWDTPMTLFNPETGEAYLYRLDQDSFVVSPDGKLFISHGKDQRLHYWGVPKS